MTEFPPQGQLRKADRTRARILDAAAENFRARGYGGANLRDIAAAAQMQAGSIYYHFGSRDELVLEVLRVGQDLTSAAVTARLAALPLGADALQRLRAMIHAHAECVAVRGGYTAAALRLLGTVPPTLRERQIDAARGYGDLWRQTILDGQLEGTIRTDVNASALRMLIIGALNSVPDWYTGSTSTASARSLAGTFSAVFIDGLADQRPSSYVETQTPADLVVATEPMTISRADRTRARIMESAAAAFRMHGFEEAALVDVAAAAGLQRESLYYHFSSRDDLAEQLLRQSWQRTALAVRRAVDALPTSASARQRLDTAIAAHVLSVLDTGDQSGAVLHVLARLPQEVRQDSLHEQRAHVRYLCHLVLAVTDFPGSPRLAGSTAALVLVNGLNWSAEWYSAGGALSASELARQCASVVIDGLASKLPQRG